jgi:hypothetical protein
VTDPHAPTQQSPIKVSVTAPGRVGASRLDVHCTECGAQESRYVPRGTVSVEHVCGDGWKATTTAATTPAGTRATETARAAG